MDFSFSDEQQSIARLAHQVLSDACGQEHLRKLEKSGAPRFDRALWAQVADTGLAGLAIPESSPSGSRP
ncbi:MAG: acyl-CoA dehydrogenase family protein [Myxococcota bacterium]